MTRRFAAALVLVAVLSGCAATGPVDLPPASASAPATQAAPPARVAPAAPGSVAETPPSPEALAVLASIPEPVPAQANAGRGGPSAPVPSRETPPQAGVPAAPPSSSPSDSSTRAAIAADSAAASADAANVPVPAPTTPLGAASQAMPPTPELPVVAPPPAPVAPAPIASAAAGADTCWRVQVGAPSERARGRMLRDASQSLLMAPMTLASDAGRWKVRFETSERPAVGVFEARGSDVTGTFLTSTGDDRFLAGSYERGRLRLSCFDGAHAFLFDARATGERLAGTFHSGNAWTETWSATRDAEESAALPRPPRPPSAAT